MEAGMTGLAKVNYIYEHRDARAKELQRHGQKVIGFLCTFAPLEFMTALDLVPYRIMGNLRNPITNADEYIENNLCPYVRNCFDLALKDKYSFLDGLVVPHACDTVQRIFGLWKYYLKPPYAHFLNVPHTLTGSSPDFFKGELVAFKESLERFAGREIGEADLKEAIALHNENRRLIRELYDLKKQDPPLLTGVETIRLMVVSFSIPAPELNALLREVKAEVLGRKPTPPPGRARVMVYGSIVDDEEFISIIEGSGAAVVTDDTCIGMRSYASAVAATVDPFDGLVKCYFEDFRCPRTDHGITSGRFDYLVERAQAAKAQGMIAYVLKYCDPHGFDVPDVRDYMQAAGFPVLYLEDDYSISNIGQLKTRAEAFVETLGR